MFSDQLSECNKCKGQGFPNTLIGFQKDAIKKKDDGKPFWNLMNPDGSPHTHKTRENNNQIEKLESVGADIKEDTYRQPISEIMKELQQIKGFIATLTKKTDTIMDHLAERAIGDE